LSNARAVGQDGRVVLEVRRLAPPTLAASLLQATAGGTVLLLLPIDGLHQAGLIGGFALPGMMSLGAALMPVPGALLVGRLGHKKVMSGGMLLAALSVAALGLATTTPTRALAAFVYGVGLGLYALSRITYLSDAVPPERRGQIVSAVGGMGRVGMFIGPAAGGFVATSFGRNQALLGVAAVMAVAACLQLLAPSCPTLPAREAHTNPLRLLRRVVAEHRHTFATVGAAMLALALVRNGRMLLIPICGTMLGLDEGEVGFVKSASMGVDMLLFYPAGLMMDRMGRKWTAVPCLLVLSIGVLLIGHATSYTAFLTAAVIAGAGNGLGAGINMTLAGDFSPREGRADFLGVWSLMTEAGAAASPFVMGAVATALSLGPASIAVAGIGGLGVLLVVRAVKEPLVRRAAGA
jgi:MFS family permease